MKTPANSRKRLPLLILIMAIVSPGCADDRMVTSESEAPTGSAAGPMPPAFKAERFASAAGAELVAADKATTASPNPAANRKIISNARVDLVTEDLGKLDVALTKLIAARQAYVADSERSGTSGDNRHATWKVRVPVDGYDGFLQGVTALGELVSLKADSQDVGEEYFDTEARVVAKKAEEARLLKHLDVSTGKLEEILAVERELTRVRGEIERMQGRLRYLGNMTALATVTISAREIKGYVPPQAPTLATRLSRTFFNSVASLRTLGESVLLFLAAVAPWLPLALIAVALTFWVSRRLAPWVRTRYFS